MNLLKITPQKDGIETKYLCGLILIGYWASRLNQYRTFIESDMGKYILKLEAKTEPKEVCKCHLSQSVQMCSLPNCHGRIV